MKLETTVTVWREDEQFIAHAMPLDVMSSGRTHEEARHAVAEAVRVFLETAEERGVLETILEECGYRRKNDEWLSPEWVGTERTAIPA
jgi:predicted RNase H-like HicB family nuclease